MGFLDSMKRALGFDAVDDNDIEIEGIDATVRPLNSRKSAPVQEPRRQTSSRSDEEVTPEEALPAVEPEMRPDPSVIFDRVVVLFNEALPGFLQKSVDPIRQRQALYDALDASIKEYYEHLERNTERRLQVRFENDRRRLQTQIDDLRVKAQKEEEGNSNAKNLQLSAERQKRALSERVHDLEKQLATLEAENEQYILENKSMANKLRMAAIAGDAPDENIAAELQKLQEQNAELQKLSAQTEQQLATSMKAKNETETQLKDAREQIDALEKQIQVHSASENDDMELLVLLQEENGELKRSKEELEVENTKLRDSLEQAKVKDELGVAMVNDLNSKAHVAKNEASEAKLEAESARNEAATAKEEAAAVQNELEALRAKYNKAQEDLQVVKEIQQEVMKLEENQRLTEAQIRTQKDELMEKDERLKQMEADILSKNTAMRIQEETIKRLEDQADALRKNVESALYDKSQIESALRSEIDRLKSFNKGAIPTDEVIAVAPQVETVVEEHIEDDLMLDLPEFVPPQPEAVETPKPRRGRPPKQKAAEEAPNENLEGRPEKKVEPDNDLDLLDSTDWLVASPPEDVKPKRQRKQKNTSDDSFGYKEPERQEPPDNPAQMLLW